LGTAKKTRMKIMVRGPEDIDEEEDDENDRISDDLNVYDREISSTYE
jgi:hypothetical protein